MSSLHTRPRTVAGFSVGLVGLWCALWIGAAGALSAARAIEEDHRPPVRIIIGLDLSKSNPLVDSTSYAAATADFLADTVKDLPFASVVNLRTFGSYGARANNLRIDRTISSLPDEKPAAVASLVREVVTSIPKLVRNGTLDAQSSTNIIAFLENMSDLVDCNKMEASVLLVSDGIENSEYANLSRSSEHLPRPSSRMFAGCSELEIIGLGQGQMRPSLTEHLRSEWSAWAKAAGFRSFSGFNSW
jgi:hypothetical protein